MAAFSVLMTGLVLQTVNGVSITHMKDVGLNPSYVMLVSSLHSVALTLFKFLTGALYDKYGLRVTTIICDIAAVAVMIAIAAVTNSFSGMVLAMFFGIFSSLALPLETVKLPIIVVDIFGQKSYNQMIGIFTALNSIRYAIGSPLANVTYDKLGTYQPMFVVCCITMIAVVVVFQVLITMAYKNRKAVSSEINK